MIFVLVLLVTTDNLPCHVLSFFPVYAVLRIVLLVEQSKRHQTLIQSCGPKCAESKENMIQKVRTDSRRLLFTVHTLTALARSCHKIQQSTGQHSYNNFKCLAGLKMGCTCYIAVLPYDGAPKYAASRKRSLKIPPAVTSAPAPGPLHRR